MSATPRALDESPSLPLQVRRLLRAYSRRRRWLQVVERCGVGLAATAVVLAAALALDRYLILGTGLRLLLSVLSLTTAAAAAGWAGLAALRPARRLELARAIEAASPSWGDALLSTVSIAQRGSASAGSPSPQLTARLFAATAIEASSFDLTAILDARRARRGAIAGGLAALLMALGLLARPGEARLLLARLVQPLEAMEKPATVQLEITPGSISAARGSDLEIVVRACRGSPGEGWLEMRLEGDPWTESRHAFVDGAFTERFSALRRSLEYRVRAGDCLSPVHRVSVREAPRAIAFRWTVRSPDYARRAPETIEQRSGDLAVLKGSRADLEVEASEPLVRASLELHDASGSRVLELAVAGARARLDDLPVAGGGAYSLRLETADGLRGGDGARYTLRALEDQPPAVEILEPREAEIVVEASTQLDLVCRAGDDVGVEAFDLLIAQRAGSGTSKVRPLALPEARAAVRLVERLDAGALGLEPGQTAELVLRARDALGQESRTPGLTLRAALMPDPPEGPGWPGALADLEAAVRTALADWIRLLPAAAEPGADLPPLDPAQREKLPAAAERSLAIAAYLQRTAVAAIAAGRAIAVPSVNREALEGAGRLLRRLAEEEGAAFWTEAARARQDPAAASRLAATWRAAGRRLEDVATALAALLRCEELEELAERAAALELEAAAASALTPERLKSLRGEATRLAALLTRAAASSVPATEDLPSAARLLLESAAVEAKDKQALLLAGVTGARSRLEEAHARCRRQAAQARRDLTPPAVLEAALTALAGSLEPAGALVKGREALRALAEDLEVREAREYSDLDSTSELAALAEAIETALEALVAGTSDAAASRQDFAALLEAYRDTSPSRAIGGALQAIHAASGGEEDIASGLRSAKGWHPLALRRIASAQREVDGVLAAARGELEAVRGAAADRPAIHEPLTKELAAIDGAAKRLQAALAGVAPPAAGVPPAPAAVSAAADAAVDAARALEGAVAALEKLRAAALPEAVAARAFLRRQIGSLADRVLRLSVRQRAHAAQVREAARTLDSVAAGDAIQELFLAEDEMRRECQILASQVRKEADRRLARRRPPREMKLADEAARGLAAAAAGEMTTAARTLRRLRRAASAAALGGLIEAAVAGEKAADAIAAAARSIALLETREEVELSAGEIEKLLAAGAKGGDEPFDLARIAREARAYLDGCQRAAGALTQRRDIAAAPLLILIQEAAACFRAALDSAALQALDAALQAFRDGRARLEEAASLARRLRGESDEAMAAVEAAADAARENDPEAAPRERSREVAAVYAELEKLLRLEKLEQDVAAQIEVLLAAGEPDAGKVSGVEQTARQARRELEESYLTLDELVELVARLVTIDRDGQDVAQAERALAGEVSQVRGEGPGVPQALVARQSALEGKARQVTKDLQAAGFKVSAIVPQVLRSYWKAGEAVDPLLAALTEAGARLTGGSRPEEALLAAASRLDDFLRHVQDMRRTALEAIADAERGAGGDNAAQASLEQARAGLEEAMSLLQQGDLSGAGRAAGRSRRSIADSVTSLRSQAVAAMSLPAEEGGLGSRLLAEEASRLGLGWDVATRGSGDLAPELDAPAVGEMAFPPSYRELVRIYLRALGLEMRAARETP